MYKTCVLQVTNLIHLQQHTCINVYTYNRRVANFLENCFTERGLLTERNSLEKGLLYRSGFLYREEFFTDT